ncbi:MAG: 50S ribosomal protein L23 [Phycisphaerales bacterium]|jgi:large subunit ribosomal protein L23|nr:50S ribosomal protein L23 [Phycisphaerales bacterium]
MDAMYVIKKPLLTEKSTHAMNEEGKYTFLVDRLARKDEIKRAVEELYKVKVERVWTQNRKGKERRLRYGYVTEQTSKKATVRLKEGQVIELF